MILQPYDMEVGAGTFHPATTLRALGPEALERGLRPALAPAQGRPLRREPQPAAALLPVPGDPEAVAARHPGPLSRQPATRIGIDPDAARHPLRRGRLGEPDARRLGPRLGGLVRRHGGDAVHLLPAGRRLRLRAGLGRDHLRPRAPGDVCAGRRNVYDLDFNGGAARQSATATCSCRPSRNTRATISSAPTPRCCSSISTTPRRNARRCSPMASRPAPLALPAYDQCIKASHNFNLLDARGVISVTERASLHRPRPRARQSLLRSLAEARRRGARPDRSGRACLSFCSNSSPKRSRRACRRRPRETRAALDRRARDRGLRSTARAFATPRRLALVVDGLPRQAARRPRGEEGPARRRARQAIEGFLRSAGLKRRPGGDRRRTPRATSIVAVIERKGRPTAEMLAEIVPEIVRNLPWPKSHALGCGRLRWVRPLHSILCTFDGEVVPFEIAGVDARQRRRAATASSRRRRSRCAASTTTSPKLRKAT